MSEMQQLEKQAKESYVKQRMEDVGAYLDDLIKECNVRFRWMLRCDLLELVALFGYWAILLTGIFMDAPDEVRHTCTDLAFVVWAITIARGWSARTKWREKEGEWTGAIEILHRLGMMPDRPEGEGRKRKRERHPFAGLAEMWESLKQKARDKVYQPAPGV